MRHEIILHLIISCSQDPFRNLAIENYLLDTLDEDQKCLFLYTNRPCVVIGRFQNPWIECDLKKMQEDGVELVRRQSGGGCVYHDLGNINFSFINWKKNHNKENNQNFLLRFFNLLNIPVRTNARGDLVLEKAEGIFKISGSAFKQKKDRAFHHGTLLFHTDLARLNSYLLAGSREKDFESKSIESVRSNVANLESFILLEDFVKKIKTFEDVKSVKELRDSDLIDQAIDEYEKKIREPVWLWGETPYFSRSLEHQSFCLDLKVKKAKIVEFKLSCSLIHASILENIEQSFRGRSFSYAELINVFMAIEGAQLYKDEFEAILNIINDDLLIKN
jgi:lipoate-protein ligase A